MDFPVVRAAAPADAGAGWPCPFPVMYDIGRSGDMDGFKVLHRDAADVPKLLLLHRFPSAGHMSRDLIPLLAARFRLVAPELPGLIAATFPGNSSP